nr:hypothetical protein [Synechocystis salina]
MWLNFLALLPATVLTVLLIAIAFLRFYDQTDFEFLGYITQPRQWSNGFTVAALLATLANFGVEWNRRNRETNRLAQEAQRRIEEEQRRIREEQRRIREEQRRMAQERADESRRAEERERQIARTRIETRCRIAEIQFQLDPSDGNRRALREALALLAEYGDLFS